MSFLSGLVQGIASSPASKPVVSNVDSYGNHVAADFSRPYKQPVQSSLPQTPDMSQGVSSSDMMNAAPSTAVPGSGELMGQFPQAYKIAQALGQVESSGNYNAMGPTVKGQNAIGKYQVMPFNLSQWGTEAIGRPVTPEEFKSDHSLQDRLAVYKINSYLQQGYTPQDVASLWLSGKPLQGNNRKDLATGIGVPEYVNRFNGYYNT